jgi:hypothetical protein
VREEFLVRLYGFDSIALLLMAAEERGEYFLALEIV